MNKDTQKVTHSTGCKRVFSRYDATCPRCQELMNGATARQGWGDNARRAEAMRIESIRTHNCKQHGCMSVCVYGDW